MKKLRDYQLSGVRFGRALKDFGLFWEMRLGKTLTAIRTVKTYDPSERENVLIVAPFSAWAGWCEDLASEGLEGLCLGGTMRKREKALCGQDGWFITNYESFRGLERALLGKEWGTIILDESDCIKNPSAKVTKFYMKNFRDVAHRIILTGTPATESDMNYFSQLKFLDSASFKEKNWFEWRRNWCYLAGFKWLIKASKAMELKRVIAKYCSVLKRSDVSLGNEKMVVKRYVEFNAATSKQYTTILNEFLLEAESGEVLRTAQETLQTYIWMRQLTSGLVLGKLSWTGKMDELLSIVAGLNGAPVVVWASFNDERFHISSALANAGISTMSLDGSVSLPVRQSTIKLFQERKFQVLVANPDILKYGADLSVADTMVWYSLPTSGKVYDQASDRTTAIVKEQAVTNYVLMVKGSIDELLMEALESKDARQNANHHAIRRLQEMRHAHT